MKPNPGTPLCAIKGCEKRARKLGMCVAHAAIAGDDYSLRAADEAQRAARQAAARVHRSAQTFVRATLRDRAS